MCTATAYIRFSHISSISTYRSLRGICTKFDRNVGAASDGLRQRSSYVSAEFSANTSEASVKMDKIITKMYVAYTPCTQLNSQPVAISWQSVG